MINPFLILHFLITINTPTFVAKDYRGFMYKQFDTLNGKDQCDQYIKRRPFRGLTCLEIK